MSLILFHLPYWVILRFERLLNRFSDLAPITAGYHEYYVYFHCNIPWYIIQTLHVLCVYLLPKSTTPNVLSKHYIKELTCIVTDNPADYLTTCHYPE